MTEEGFKKYLKPRIEAGIAFSAYWYPNGFGLILTGPMPRTKRVYELHQPGKPTQTYTDWNRAWKAEQRINGAWLETKEIPDKPRQITETARKRWQRSVEQLRRGCWEKFITVEFDGTSISTSEEGFEL